MNLSSGAFLGKHVSLVVLAGETPGLSAVLSTMPMNTEPITPSLVAFVGLDVFPSVLERIASSTDTYSSTVRALVPTYPALDGGPGSTAGML